MLRWFIRVNRRCSWALSRRFPRFSEFKPMRPLLLQRINNELDGGARLVLEVGGSDRPLLEKGGTMHYVGLDIEDVGDPGRIYDEFRAQSVEEPISGKFDLIFSMTLMEHVPDNRLSMRNMYQALEPGGSMHHYVPSAYHPYAILLRIMGVRLQNLLIDYVKPEYAAKTGYPTYFSYCTVPAMRDLLEKTGFCDIDIEAGYRANDYFSFFLPLYVLVTAWENLAAWFGWVRCASGFVVSAKRPISNHQRME